MTVYLVRHADAKSRAGWDGPDELRPLTKKGERQARALIELLRDAKVASIHTSPAVRCVDTVAPLGASTHVTVVETHELEEGAEPKGAMRLLRACVEGAGDSVLCTHGDLIPEVLRKLARDGARLDGDRWAKGSTWELEVVDGEVVAGRYHPAPEPD